jgi:1,4-dihydroxy-6-naphthoate synthase
MTTASARVRLAFSPDSDDIFMFWALLNGKVDPEGLEFVAERADTETLNQRASQADVDVIAVSMARYAAIADKYLLLPHGASVGRGYGPIVVAAPGTPGTEGTGPEGLAALRGKRIAIPGVNTTAFLVLRLLLAEFEPVVVPIVPYARVFESLRAHEVDAALLIHEGRLTYEREGFARVADMGEGWAALTGGLPLPLGGNAIRRGLGDEAIAKISRLSRASIVWALDHREEVMDALVAAETRKDVVVDRALLDRYLTMYANDDTLELPPDGRQAVTELFTRGHAAGFFPSPPPVAFAP